MTTVTHNGVEFNNKDLDIFVSGAFYWADTPEGQSYWAHVTSRFDVSILDDDDYEAFILKVREAAGAEEYNRDAFKEVGAAVLTQVLSEDELKRWKKNVGANDNA